MSEFSYLGSLPLWIYAVLTTETTILWMEFFHGIKNSLKFKMQQFCWHNFLWLTGPISEILFVRNYYQTSNNSINLAPFYSSTLSLKGYFEMLPSASTWVTLSSINMSVLTWQLNTNNKTFKGQRFQPAKKCNITRTAQQSDNILMSYINEYSVNKPEWRDIVGLSKASPSHPAKCRVPVRCQPC